MVVLLFCPCLGLAGWALLWATDRADDLGPVPVTPAGPPSASPTPAPRLTMDDFAVGDCVVNDGTGQEPDLRTVPCGPDTQQIVLRIPGVADGALCGTRAPRATATYVNDAPVDVFDFVLCLRRYSR
ncbi:LppU/SCO3897 family protein [Micromonospora cathayae]|uniref:Subtilisin inhibitor-like n=1 Tax=Micromonospora cathayae TaxID=3028804 RepID=A0ABY7ZTZ9_9ACTN|nr:hypothetical protein [Micromonospora sp. HUAS 3]WDZ85968.1 hypothetical protein PVK37_05945 [Micromonospora sp. HUAS 3]